MKIILVSVYGLAALFAIFCGRIFPEAESWSYLTAVSCGVHLVLALVVAWRPLLDAGKVAAWFWQGLSALLVAGMFLAYGLGKGGGWLLAGVALALFTVLVTLVLALVLKRGGVADS